MPASDEALINDVFHRTVRSAFQRMPQGEREPSAELMASCLADVMLSIPEIGKAMGRYAMALETCRAMAAEAAVGHCKN